MEKIFGNNHGNVDGCGDRKNESFSFSGRMDPSLSVDFGGTMIDADGAQGEKGTYGKPSPWIDCFGKRGDKIEGMANIAGEFKKFVAEK